MRGRISGIGAWRSLVAHLLWEQRVGGSNPSAPTNKTARGQRSIETICRRSSSILRLFLAAGLILSGTGEALAEEREEWRDDPLGNRFMLGVGLYSPTLTTIVRQDSSNGILGTEIEFESTLGMDDNDQLPLVLGYYRFAKKHRIGFQHFRLNRNGDSVSDAPIRFGDLVFPANLPLSSYFNVDVYSFSYAYSLLHDEKKELTFSFGLQFQDIQMGIAGNLGPGFIREDSDVFLPLPTFGASFDYAFSDKWIFSSLIGVFGLDLDLGDDSEFAGEITQINAGIIYKAFKNVAVGLKYNYFRVDVDIADPSWLGALEYEYRGPVLAFGIFF